MIRNYYLLPASYCANALAMRRIAMDDAMSNFKEIVAHYGCHSVAMNGSRAAGLIFRSRTELAGFRTPEQMDGFWVTKPKRNTKVGKQCVQKLAELSELVEIRQWCLERALGVFGIVFGPPGNRAFHYLHAHPLADGRVVLDAPGLKNAPRGPGHSRTFEDPVIPASAEAITAERAWDLAPELREIYSHT